MISTDEELKKIRIAAILNNTLDGYVYLKEDDKGRYIEYAFKEGAPHDNRCLSWYVKPHLTYSEKHNGWNTPFIRKNVGELYELGQYSCGHHNEPINSDQHCSPGHPCKKCVEDGLASDWTYDEPVKCACWTLYDPKIPKYISIPIDKVIELYEKNLLNYEAI